jgi:hypothetical protein
MGVKAKVAEAVVQVPEVQTVQSAQLAKQQDALRVMEEAANRHLDVAPEGGRYVVLGRLVDADGAAVEPAEP